MAAHGGGTHLEVPHRVRRSDEETRWTKWEPAIDAVLVAILAVASLLAAWSAYQAHHWNGDQSSNYAHASALLLESASQSTLGMQLSTVDVTTFVSYVDAFAQGNNELADFYAARFRPDFKPAFNAWMALDPLTNPNAPPSPFAMQEYLLPETQRAQDLEAEANSVYAEGEESKKNSEEYVLNTVILATVLFFAGIAPRVRWVPASLALITLSTAMLAVGLYQVIVLPMAH